jgi:hypothetical protein
MSRKGILFFAGCLMLSMAPAYADETGINIIYPPPRDEAVAMDAQPATKALNQTVTVAVITVTSTQPFAAGSWYQPRWDNRWTGYGLRGGDRSYSGPRYPF